METVDKAVGHKEFWLHVQKFMGENNFSHEETLMLMHLLNSFYFMGKCLNGDNKAEVYKYRVECKECGLIQASNRMIPLTQCCAHRERLNPETPKGDAIV
jgi:hypothetical protein